MGVDLGMQNLIEHPEASESAGLSPSRGKPTRPDRKKRMVIKTFRLPADLVGALATDAEKGGTTVSGQLVSILTRYAEFDRFAQRFGFVTVNRGLFKAIVDEMTEDRIREVATSQSETIDEMVEFWYGKRDVESVLAIIDVFSRYMRRFEYTVTRRENELLVTLRSELGRKLALFMGTYWSEGISRVLDKKVGVEVARNQVTLRIPN